MREEIQSQECDDMVMLSLRKCQDFSGNSSTNWCRLNMRIAYDIFDSLSANIQ